MNMMRVRVNNQEVSCHQGSTILEAAMEAGFKVPTLCFLKKVNEIGDCRICAVKVKGEDALVPSCITKISEGMEIVTNSKEVCDARRIKLELILANHRKDCLSCVRSLSCELQRLAADLGVKSIGFSDDEPKPQIERSTVHLERDNSKCIMCRRCTATCKEVQGLSVIDIHEDQLGSYVGCKDNRRLDEMGCVGCGQCISVCPTGALTEVSDLPKVYNALADKSKHVVVVTAPAVRVALGECFGMSIGTNVEGKMVTALRRIGFDKVFDVPVGADFTVIEESAEIIRRLETGNNLPVMTSCCCGWVSYCEQHYPEFIPNLSSCKPPQIMLGALLRVYYAKKKGIDPEDLYIVSVMPCTGKKEEITRPDNQAIPGLPDIDVVITTRELARMIKLAGLSFKDLEGDEFDPALGISTAAGYIFGSSGGVAEAAMRTIVEEVTGTVMDKTDYTELRGMDGIKEAKYDLNGKIVKVAVVSGLKNVGTLLDKIKRKEVYYDVVEVMASPGGCIGGGGQPIHDGFATNYIDINNLRSKALYQGANQSRPLRKAHESPIIKEIYKDIIGEVGGENAHKWLHTKYKPRPVSM